MSRNTLLAACIFLLTYAGCFYFRIYVVDTPVDAGSSGVFLAAVRQGVLFGQLFDLWGMASLASGLLALFYGGRALVCLWSLLTAMALCNYNVDLGSIGLVLGILRVVRL